MRARASATPGSARVRAGARQKRADRCARALGCALALSVVGALACSERSERGDVRPAATAPAAGSPAPASGATPGAAAATAPATGDPVALGRQVYLSICSACHNADPNRDGSVGPANAGASRALLEAKILRGEYPPGYTPKRPSAIMPRFENLAGSIDDLAAFLAYAKANPPR